MPITQTIDSIGTPPSISDPATFESRADNVLNNGLPTLVTQLNAFAGQANSLESNVNAKAALLDYYQGALASDPALDTNGGPLVAGDWYVNTATGSVRVYTGSSWVQAVGAVAGVSSVNGQTGAVTDVVFVSDAQTLTNKTLTSPAVNNEKLTTAREAITISATAATGTINYDALTQAVLYYTTNASANWTVNFRGSAGTSLNTMMATGESLTVAFMVTQGATPYYNSAVQVDGSAVTPKWQGGTAPTAGNASGIDVYTYTIIKTGNAAFTVLAAQTQFK